MPKARTVVPYSPILSRIRYLTDYLFVGDIRKFEQELGYYRRQLEYILRRQAKIPNELLSALVADYGVSAHWLLTGSGPVFDTVPFQQVSASVRSQHALFDPTRMRVRTSRVEQVSYTAISRHNVSRLAKDIFTAKTQNAPVILLFDWLALEPERREAVLSLLRANHVTALAATTRALYKDVGGLAPKVIGVARRAARCGVGLGTAVGRWLKLDKHSVFRAAYSLCVPFSVYYQPGDDYRYFESAVLGPTVGAEIGAATQIDLFLLAEQIRLFVTTEHSVCIDTTNNKSVTALLTNVLSAAHRTTDERHGRVYKMSNNLLPFVVQSCQTVFEGNNSASRRNDRSRSHR